MRLLCIDEIYLTNIKVAECREGAAQVSVAMVHQPLLIFGLPYMWYNSCLH